MSGGGSQQLQQRQSLLPAKAGDETQTVGAFHGRPTLCSATVGGIGIVLVLLSRNTSPVKDSQEEAKRNWSVQVSETKERYHRDLYIEPKGAGHRENRECLTMGTVFDGRRSTVLLCALFYCYVYTW